MHLTIQDVSSFTIPMASFIRLIRTLVRQHGVCIGFYKQKCQHLHKQQDLHYKKKDNKQSSEKIIRRLFILYTTCEFIYHFLRWYINKLQPSKHRGKHFTVLGALTIVIALLNHLHAGTCCIGDVRYWQSVVDGNSYRRISEHIGVQVEVLILVRPA